MYIFPLKRDTSAYADRKSAVKDKRGRAQPYLQDCLRASVQSVVFLGHKASEKKLRILPAAGYNRETKERSKVVNLDWVNYKHASCYSSQRRRSPGSDCTEAQDNQSHHSPHVYQRRI